MHYCKNSANLDKSFIKRNKPKREVSASGDESKTGYFNVPSKLLTDIN